MPTGPPPAAAHAGAALNPWLGCRRPVGDRPSFSSVLPRGVVRSGRPMTWRRGSAFDRRLVLPRRSSPYLPLPRNCAEARNGCSALLLTPVRRWRFSCGWQMIAGLAAPGAPLFTPQRGTPTLPFERLAPKHPGGQFSFGRKLAADPRRHRHRERAEEVAASRSSIAANGGEPQLRRAARQLASIR
jgi:hypothetical protein